MAELVPKRSTARNGAIIVILMVLSATGLQTYFSFNTVTAEDFHTLSRSDEIVGYELGSSFQVLDELLAEITERISPARWPEPALVPWLTGRLSASPAIDTILVIGLNGLSVGPGVSAQGEFPNPLDVRDREYFRYFQDHPQDHGNHVGAPFVSRLDDRFSLPVARAFFDAGGRPAGLARVTVDPRAMLGDVLQLAGGGKAAAAVFFDDGTLLADSTLSDPDFPRQFSVPALLRSLPPGVTAGTAEIVGSADGKGRLLAFRLLRPYNLVAVAGMRSATAYSAWRDELYRNGALALALCGIVLAIALASDRRERQRRFVQARAESARRQTARVQLQLSEAIGNLNDAIALFDAADRLVVCNGAFAAAFGYDQSSPPAGTPFMEIARHRNGIADKGLLDRHRAATGEAAVLQSPDGGWTQIRECRGRDGGVLTICSDITDLKRREEDLKSLQHRYALILDAAGDGIIGLDLEGRISFVNRAGCDLLLCEAGELLGRPVSDLFIDGSDVDLTRVSVDARFRRPGGSAADVQYQAAPIIEDGRAAGAVMVFRDVALQRQYEAELADHRRELERQVAERTAELQRENQIRARTEQALRASRERLRSITDSLYHCVLVYNHAGHAIFANVAARNMLGVAGQEVEGQPIDDLLRIVENGEDVLFESSPLLEAVLAGAAMHDNDAVIRTRDGVDIPVAYVCTPLAEEGQRRSVVLSFRDIADIKQAQWEAMQASRLASVGQLASGIAHEINTPVQYIGNNLSFIGDSVKQMLALLQDARGADGASMDERAAFLAEELPVAITESLEGVAQIARIVLSMKEFSHPGSTSKALTDINRALETTLTVTTNVWKHVAEIERRFDPDLPPVPCHAGEMNQVFLNLIVNAVHAIEGSGKPLPGRITLSTARNGDQVDITIADSGTGIPATIREKIFDPFFTTKEVGKGTGQGLAICQDVVITKHGGKIGVGGAEGEGAVFVISLPIEGPATREGAA